MFQKLLNNPIFAATVGGLLVAGLLSIFLLTKVVTEVYSWIDGKTEVYPSKTITVYGEGEEIAVPNIASFNFSIMESGDTVEAAQKLATEKNNKAIAFLKQSNVEDKDIKATGYNVNPKYDFGKICNSFDCPPSEPKIIGYEVTQNISVKVRQQEDAGKFLTELGRIGVSNISGLNFTIDDDQILKEKAREKALIKAKEDAEKLAKQLGVKLDDIVSFGEEQPYNQPEMFGMGSAKAMDVSMSPVLPVGENIYKSKVWITYEIK